MYLLLQHYYKTDLWTIAKNANYLNIWDPKL